jgi:hypothetical protein
MVSISLEVGRREDKVGQEEGRLASMAQVRRAGKDLLQVRHQRHVQVGDEPEDEEQRGDGDERNKIPGRRERRRLFGCAAIEGYSPLPEKVLAR